MDVLSTNELLTIDEARKILRVGKNTMYQLANQVGFPCIRLGKQIRIPLNSMMAWAENQANLAQPK